MKTSRVLSYLLRHHPEHWNIKLEKAGWAKIPDILKALELTRIELLDIVKNDDKQRFDIQNNLIRANQGHSIPVKIEFKTDNNHDTLYHGTSKSALKKILKQGLKPMSRLYVHLSKDIETASKVGKRKGDLVILKIDTKQMKKDGFSFKISKNGVYLIEAVHKRYLTIL